MFKIFFYSKLFPTRIIIFVFLKHFFFPFSRGVTLTREHFVDNILTFRFPKFATYFALSC